MPSPHRPRGGAAAPRVPRRSSRVVLSGVAAVLATATWLAAPGAASPAGDGPQVVEETMAAPNDLRDPRAHNSPKLAVDPTNPRFVVLAHRLDAPEFSCGLQLFGDGGESWVGGEPVVELPEGVDHCYGPQVAFDAEGTLHYLFVGLTGQGNTPEGAWLVSSSDRGRTFTRPRQVLGRFSYQVRLAVDRTAGAPGRMHLVWLSTGEGPIVGGLPPVHNPIMTAHSDDGGRTFSDPVEVSGPEQRLVVAPAMALGASGQVHVAYYDLQDDVRDYQGLEGPVWPDPWTVEVATSHDGGETFDRVVVGEARPAERVMVIFTMPPPTVAADGDGQVYAAWHRRALGQEQDWDVAVAASGDAGQAWAEPVVVDDEGARALLPQLAVAPDGRVELVYFERGEGAAGEHRQHVAYSRSADHGRTFAPPARLTSEASDVRSGPRFHLPVAQGMVEWGTGLALHAGEAAALVAWPDTRFSVPGTAQQDLSTTQVVRSAEAAGTAPGWWPVAGGVVAVVLLVLLVTVRRRRRGATAALLALLAAGCQAGAADEAPLPEPPAHAEIELDEYRIDVDARLAAGRTVVDVRNRGADEHELVLVRLPDAGPGLDELLAAESPRALAPTYAVPAREPGGSGRFAVDLEPGRYGLFCFLPDDTGTSHYRRGMATELAVDG